MAGKQERQVRFYFLFLKLVQRRFTFDNNINIFSMCWT